MTETNRNIRVNRPLRTSFMDYVPLEVELVEKRRYNKSCLMGQKLCSNKSPGTDVKDY